MLIENLEIDLQTLGRQSDRKYGYRQTDRKQTDRQQIGRQIDNGKTDMKWTA